MTEPSALPAGMTSRENRITPDMAERIWRVLVEECGCRDDLHAQHRFTRYLATEHWSGHEWRFQGALGFGGKFHNNAGRWYVSCYGENRTPERDEMIRKANARIAGLRSGRPTRFAEPTE